MQSTNHQTPQALIDFLLGNPSVEEVKDQFAGDADVTFYALTEEMGVQTIGADATVLYVTKGKIVVGDAASLAEGTDAIAKHTFLLGAGEPYHKNTGNLGLLYACKGDCELFLFQFKDQSAAQSAEQVEVGAAIEQAFRQAAEKLDDYYFGYDERYAQVYEAGAELWESDKPNDSLLNVLNKHRNLFEGKIIDLGCGEGRDSLYLASQGLDVTGVDVSRSALTKARERANHMNLDRAKFVETDVIFLRLMNDNTYDFAMNMGCLHMLVDAEQRSKHIQRVYEILKPGGYFLVDHCQENWGKGFYSIPDYDKVANDLVPGKSIPRRIRVEQGEAEINLKVLPYSEKSKNELIEEFSQYGFQVVDVETSDTEAFGNSAVVLFQKI